MRMLLQMDKEESWSRVNTPNPNLVAVSHQSGYNSVWMKNPNFSTFEAFFKSLPLTFKYIGGRMCNVHRKFADGKLF